MGPAQIPAGKTRALPGPKRDPHRNSATAQNQPESNAGEHTCPVELSTREVARTAAQNRPHVSVPHSEETNRGRMREHSVNEMARWSDRIHELRRRREKLPKPGARNV